MKIVTVQKNKGSEIEVAFSSNNNAEAMTKAVELSKENYLAQVHELPNAHKRFWNESQSAPVKKKATSKKSESSKDSTSE